MRRRVACACVLAASALVAAAAAPCALAAVPGVLPPPPAQTALAGFGAGPAGPAVSIRLDPAVPDGSYGWYVSPTRVWLSADGKASFRYRWDGTAGPWAEYVEPLVVPEGKHTLYAQAVSASGEPGPLAAMPVKLSLTTRPLGDYRTFVSQAAVRSREGGVRVVALVQPPVGPLVVRVSGLDRYGTSRQIAGADWDHASTVIVARGDTFPDALSAGGLSGILDAPILLTPPSAVPDAVLAEMRRLGTTHAIVLGDHHAVSDHAEEQLLAEGLSVERIGGRDRYATAAAVARAIVARGGRRGAAMIARGDVFPDALSLSPFAFRDRRPLLLVRPRELPADTRLALSDLRISQAVIAGDTRSVSAAVQSQLEGLGVKTERHGGGDRYSTAREVARWGVSAGWGSFSFVGVATGERFADALCGGVAAGHRGGVLLMTAPGSLHPLVAAELGEHGPELREVQVYGSEAAVSDEVWDTILQIVR